MNGLENVDLQQLLENIEFKGMKTDIELYCIGHGAEMKKSHSELMMEHLNKLFDEAYLFIQGARRKKEE